MKKLMLFFTAWLLLGAIAVSGQILQTTGKAYPFPVVPGTDAWKQLRTHDDMLRITEVPANILEKMSTDDLLATALNYPLKWDASAFDNLVIGVKTVATRSNIFAELFSRKDAPENILLFYQSLDPGRVNPDWTVAEKGEFSLLFPFTESILVQPEIFNALTPAQGDRLLQQIGENTAKMRLNTELYGVANQVIPAFLAGKILLKHGIRPNLDAQTEVAEFLNSPFFYPTGQVISSIMSEMHQYLSTLKK